jgi:hypothetical protein
MKIHESVTVDRIIEALEYENTLGFCVLCGEEATGVEPDAHRYPCESCGKKGVYGAEELLFHLS